MEDESELVAESKFKLKTEESSFQSKTFLYYDMVFVSVKDNSKVFFILKNPTLTIMKGTRFDRMTFSYKVQIGGEYTTIFKDRERKDGPYLNMFFTDALGGVLWESEDSHPLSIKCSYNNLTKVHQEGISRNQIFDDVVSGYVESTLGWVYFYCREE